MVFDGKVMERDADMYSCQASFYHHAATVSFLVDVMSDEKLYSECLHLYIGEERAEACNHPGNTVVTIVTSCSLRHGGHRGNLLGLGRPHRPARRPVGVPVSRGASAGNRGRRCP